MFEGSFVKDFNGAIHGFVGVVGMRTIELIANYNSTIEVFEQSRRIFPRRYLLGVCLGMFGDGSVVDDIKMLRIDSDSLFDLRELKTLNFVGGLSLYF